MLKSKTRREKFVSYYKPYIRLFILDIVCCVAFAAIALVLPLGVRYITKDILESGMGGASGNILAAGGVMTILVIVQYFCFYLYDVKGHAMGAMMERDMRAELFAKYQELPHSFHDNQQPGKLMARITNDLLSLVELYHHGPENIAVYVTKFIGAMIILLIINAPLTGIVFVIVFIMAVVVMVCNKRLRRCYKMNYERIAEVNSSVEENLSGIRVVQSFANEDLELQKFTRANNSFLESRKDIYRTESFMSVGVGSLTQMITVLVAVFGGIGILNASLSLPDLITFLLYVAYLTEPIPSLAFMTQQFQEGVAGFERFMDIIELEPEINDAPGAKSLSAVKGAVIFEDVGFRYDPDSDYVLSGVSLDVKPGEYIALVGTSGVGKTTLCSLIPRFYDATEGRVLLDGNDVRDIRLDSLRRQIGVVHQEVYLFSGTIAENIAYGKKGAAEDEIITASVQANAHEFIQKLPDGYKTQIGHRGIKLSGGQKQRLSVARVFLKNPPILILDEATSALDTESERVVQESLEKLAYQRTTFVIAHRLSTIRGADRIIVLSDQGLGEQGTHEELMEADGLYARYYNMQYKEASTQ